MKKILLAFVLSSQAFAQDLTIPGEKWYGEFDKYICKAFEPAVQAPAEFEQYDVKFERLVTDASLDNAVVKATFVQDGQTCRYSAILLADNEMQSSELVESKAYPLNVGTTDCAAGKDLLDSVFEFNEYLYYGHPHNVAFVTSAVSSQDRCAADSIAINFVVKGKLPTSK